MKKRRKPLILLGFPAEFLAFPRWFEHPTYRLGGGRSIQLSYGNIFKIYSILVLNLLNVNRLCPKGGRYNIFLGGARSIQLSYGRILWNLGKLGFEGISLTFFRKGTKGYQTGCQTAGGFQARSRNRRFSRVFAYSLVCQADRARP